MRRFANHSLHAVERGETLTEPAYVSACVDLMRDMLCTKFERDVFTTSSLGDVGLYIQALCSTALGVQVRESSTLGFKMHSRRKTG